MLIEVINLFFVCYSLMIFVRIISSWFPEAHRYQFIRFLYHYTEPYLGFFRRFIPPLAGVIDFSPFVALIALQIVKELLIYFIIRFL